MINVLAVLLHICLLVLEDNFTIHLKLMCIKAWTFKIY